MSTDSLQEELGEWTRSLDTLVDAEASAGREIGVEQVASDVVGWVKDIGKEVTSAASRKISPQLNLRRFQARELSERVDYRPRHRSWRSLAHPTAVSYAKQVLSWFGYSSKAASARTRSEEHALHHASHRHKHVGDEEGIHDEPNAPHEDLAATGKEDHTRTSCAASLRERNMKESSNLKSRHVHVRHIRPTSATCGLTSSPEWQKSVACLLYYLFQGTILISFVTDNVREVTSLRSEQKQIMLVMLLLSVGNFFSSTTTPKSHILLVLFRALCDIANILHAVILTLLCIWSDGMRADDSEIARWFLRSPSNAKLLMLPEEHVGAVLGIVNLLFGLLRGLILLSLIPANTQLGRTCEMKDLSASSCCGHATFSSWSSCHVLTSALFIAIVNLAAPTQRRLRAPLLAMISTSLWSLAVAAGGIIMGSSSLPWPGIPFFSALSVISLLMSKHLV
ncbi:hypothetical protein GUITHDRAFT_117555 [Guillardia theta CCMP2712]|uniref:PH domain-containing protein n=1 Tax=Guillardia theta (strain CCMP2712) TaxID=905079 RepID=L1IJR1_GUITC|nr:hypothetical protein GUITHDRAFT_117555 [Guillardia theta CCMP2712]EKX36327.1 hypothetical protein GUITHDRAFT_117555 [Guillardia theta CCMP2712]|eukprot:XP_005823307.1 hypothetical protein GUITHDRAFT_117555 [Guillardia theta CCMP2712]